jgi:hypothetical protein
LIRLARFLFTPRHNGRVSRHDWRLHGDARRCDIGTARSSLRSTSYPKQADALEVLANEALNLRNELSEAITGIGIYFQSVEDTQGYEPED